jgi:hypothetical protein
MKAKYALTLLLAALSGPGWAHSQSQERFVLTAGQIAQALSGRGIDVSENQVTMLANDVATEKRPQLDVMSIAPLGERLSGEHSESRSLVKLGCHLPGICLPFYAIMSASAKSTEGGSGGTAAAPNPTKPVMKAGSVAIMPAGTHALLVMDDTRSHVQVSVVTLQNGNAGDRIRVSSPDHKQAYTAEVVDATLLRRSY